MEKRVSKRTDGRVRVEIAPDSEGRSRPSAVLRGHNPLIPHSDRVGDRWLDMPGGARGDGGGLQDLERMANDNDVE